MMFPLKMLQMPSFLSVTPPFSDPKWQGSDFDRISRHLDMYTQPFNLMPAQGLWPQRSRKEDPKGKQSLSCLITSVYNYICSQWLIVHIYIILYNTCNYFPGTSGFDFRPYILGSFMKLAKGCLGLSRFSVDLLARRVRKGLPWIFAVKLT